MGQAPSHDSNATGTPFSPNKNRNRNIETRVEDPGPWDGPPGSSPAAAADTPPRGLALVAHGRFGNEDRPLVRGLAEYFRDERRMRVVTWNDLQAGGRGVWEDLQIWTGEVGAGDYNRVLHEAMANFIADFPEVQNAELFICARPPASPLALAGHFSPARYVLISYPVEANFITLGRAGSCFRAVEALVQGHGWEDGLPAGFGGREPEVAGVLTMTGAGDIRPFYGVWAGILAGKNVRRNLWQVVVEGEGHVWTDEVVGKAVEEVRWLA